MDETMKLLLSMQFKAENAASNVIQAIASDLGNLEGGIGKIARSFSDLKGSGTALDSLGSKAKVAATETSALGASATTAEAGIAAMTVAAVAASVGIAAIGAALIASTKAAADFQTQLSRAQANTTLTTQETKAMGSAILQMSTQSGAGLADLGAGYVHIANIMGDATTATNVLDVAQQSAVSTGGSVSAYAQTLARVLHEFGMSGNEAASAMDMLHTAAAAGDLTLEQFTANSGNALAMAANYKVPLDQVAAAYISLTKHGMDAAQANTQISDQFLRLTQVTPKVEKELQRVSNLTGVNLVSDFTATGLATKGLTGIYADLRTAEEKMGMSAEQAFAENMLLGGALRGGRGLAIAAGNGYADYTSVLGQVDNATAAAAKRQADYNRYLQTTAGEMDQLKAKVLAAAVVIGGPLNDALGTLLGDLNADITAVSDLGAAFDALGTHINDAAGGWIKAIQQFGGGAGSTIGQAIGGNIASGILSQLPGGAVIAGVMQASDSIKQVQQAQQANAAATQATIAQDQQFERLQSTMSGSIDTTTSALANQTQAMRAASNSAGQDFPTYTPTATMDAQAQQAIDATKRMTAANKTAWTDAIKTVRDQIATAAAADTVMAQESHTAALATITKNETAAKTALAGEKTSYDATMNGEIAARRAQQTANANALQTQETAANTAASNTKRLADQQSAAAIKSAQDTATQQAQIVNDGYAQQAAGIQLAIKDVTYAEQQRVQTASDAERQIVQSANDAERQRVQDATNATNAAIRQLQAEKQAVDDTIAAEEQARQAQYNQDIARIDGATKAQLAALKAQEDALRTAYDQHRAILQVQSTKGEGAPAAALLTQYYGMVNSGNIAGADKIAAQLSAIDRSLADMMATDQLNREETALQNKATAIQDQATAQKAGLQADLAAFKATEAAKKTASDRMYAGLEEQDRLALQSYTQGQANQLRAFDESQAQQLRDYQRSQAEQLHAFVQRENETLAQDKTARDQQLATIKTVETTAINQLKTVQQNRDNQYTLDQQARAAYYVKLRQEHQAADAKTISDLQAQKAKQDAIYAASATAITTLYGLQKTAADTLYQNEITSINSVKSTHDQALTDMASAAATWSGSETAAVDAVTNALNAMNAALNGQAAAQDALNKARAASGKGMQYGTGVAGGTGGGIVAPHGGPGGPDGTNSARGNQILNNALGYLGDQSYDGFCETFAETVTGVGNMGASARSAWDNWGAAEKGGTPDQVGSLVYFNYGPSGHVGIYAGGGQFVSALDYPWGVTQMSMSQYEQDNGASYLGYVQPFAEGGWINEPIRGVGASGQRYSFGEREPEMIMPRSKMSAGGSSGNTIYLTVTGNTVMTDQDAERLAELVGDAIVRQTSHAYSMIRS